MTKKKAAASKDATRTALRNRIISSGRFPATKYAVARVAGAQPEAFVMVGVD